MNPTLRKVKKFKKRRLQLREFPHTGTELRYVDPDNFIFLIIDKQVCNVHLIVFVLNFSIVK